MYKDSKALIKALNYVLANARSEELLLNFSELIVILNQLKKVCRHDKYIEALIFCLKTHINKDLSLKTALTEREEEVVLLIGKGKNSQFISKSLNISKHTVESHRKNIRKKLKKHDNLNLSAFSILYAIQHAELQV